MMNVCLINPARKNDIQQFRWDGGHLGLAYIAAVLEQAKFKCSVVDGKAERLGPKEITIRVSEKNPDIVGITAMTHEIHLASEIAGLIKTKLPSTCIIIGGPHVTALPVRSLEEFSSFDVVVRGEGEKTILDILKSLKARKKNPNLGVIPGIAYRANGHIIKTEARPFMNSDELDKLPFPAWHLFPDQGLPMFAGRGCPFRCAFCMRVLGNRVRMRSPENIISEIEYLYKKFGKKGSWFRDETFGCDKKWTSRFLDLLAQFRKKYDVDWSWKVNSRVNIADYDTYKRMHELGCKELDFGIESGNPQMLRNIKKDISLRRAIKAISTARSAGLKTNAFFIIGHPNENLKTALDTIRFAAKLSSDGIAVGVMVPYPGTEIWELAKNNKSGYRLLSEDWSLYDKYFGGSLRLKNLSDRQLKVLQSFCYLWFYLRNLRFKELASFINKYFMQMMLMVKILTGNNNGSNTSNN